MATLGLVRRCQDAAWVVQLWAAALAGTQKHDRHNHAIAPCPDVHPIARLAAREESLPQRTRCGGEGSLEQDGIPWNAGGRLARSINTILFSGQ